MIGYPLKLTFVYQETLAVPGSNGVTNGGPILRERPCLSLLMMGQRTDTITGPHSLACEAQDLIQQIILSKHQTMCYSLRNAPRRRL